MKVLFVAIIAITIIAFVWKEATSILPAKVVTYIRVGALADWKILRIAVSMNTHRNR